MTNRKQPMNLNQIFANQLDDLANQTRNTRDTNELLSIAQEAENLAYAFGVATGSTTR